MFEKLEEEIGELRQALDSPPAARPERVEHEVGDLLFAAVNIARFLDIDPETALRKSNRKFVERFQFMEAALRRAGKDLGNSTPKRWKSSGSRPRRRCDAFPTLKLPAATATRDDGRRMRPTWRTQTIRRQWPE